VPSLNGTWLDFERPIVELDRRLEELRPFAERGDPEFKDEYERLRRRADRLRSEIYSLLSRWQRVQLARHPQRPYTSTASGSSRPRRAARRSRAADDAAVVSGLGRRRARWSSSAIRRAGTPRRTSGATSACHRGWKGSASCRWRARMPVVAFIDLSATRDRQERRQFEAIARGARDGTARCGSGGRDRRGGSGGALAFGVAIASSCSNLHPR
jgi:acetyl-CoA carboxylase carboxyl transferase subunit alpha